MTAIGGAVTDRAFGRTIATGIIAITTAIRHATATNLTIGDIAKVNAIASTIGDTVRTGAVPSGHAGTMNVVIATATGTMVERGGEEMAMPTTAAHVPEAGDTETTDTGTAEAARSRSGSRKDFGTGASIGMPESRSVRPTARSITTATAAITRDMVTRELTDATSAPDIVPDTSKDTAPGSTGTGANSERGWDKAARKSRLNHLGRR